MTCEAVFDILPFRLMKIFFRIIIEIFAALKLTPTFSDQQLDPLAGVGYAFHVSPDLSPRSMHPSRGEDGIFPPLWLVVSCVEPEQFRGRGVTGPYCDFVCRNIQLSWFRKS